MLVAREQIGPADAAAALDGMPELRLEGDTAAALPTIAVKVGEGGAAVAAAAAAASCRRGGLGDFAPKAAAG